MLIQESHDKIRKNFEMLEESKKRERHINIVELLFILFSILIMVPYELASTFKTMFIFGALNIVCDFIFVILLFRLIVWKKKGTLTPFIAITDILAALPGVAEIIVLLLSLFVFRDFNFGEYVAAGGLAIAALKTTKLLRILRVARLFRLIRNIKLIKFLSIKSDSNSAENVVGWLGFMLLVILIFANLCFVLFGPLSIQEDKFFTQIRIFQQDLEKLAPQSASEILAQAKFRNLLDNIIYIKIGPSQWLFNDWENGSKEENLQKIADTFCQLNSTLVKAGAIEILLDDKEIFTAIQHNNVLWVLIIIFSVLTFALITTTIIGRNFTDYLNDYRKAIIDSYDGVQSLFKIDMKHLSTNDRDSFVYAMGLYIEDFVRFVKGLQTFEKQLKLKDEEISDLNEVIKGLENDLQTSSSEATGSEDDLIKQVQSDLEIAVRTIRQLCAKNPAFLDKVRASVKFKTVKL